MIRFGEAKVMSMKGYYRTPYVTTADQPALSSSAGNYERLRELQKELVKMANQKDDYNTIADEILRLRDMRKTGRGEQRGQG